MNVTPRFIVTQSSRISGAIALLVVIALVAAPLWLSRNGIRLAGEMLVYIGLASLWNLLAGYGGLVSIGQQAYVGLGAYLLFAASMLLGVPPAPRRAAGRRGRRRDRAACVGAAVSTARRLFRHCRLGGRRSIPARRGADFAAWRRFRGQPADRYRQINWRDA
jgi:hypothetical protein